MRERLIDGLLQGDRLAWLSFGALWALTTVLVLLHRPAPFGAPHSRRAGAAFAFALLAVATATSLAGLPLSAALAVPRIRWKVVDAPELVAAGPEGWRKLRGPTVVLPGPEPDLAVPTLDAADRWVLHGVLSNQPVPGLAAAEASAAARGAPRLCRAEGSECRAWPVGWPDPARPPALGELHWSRATSDVPLRALAYDVETGLYLVRVENAAGRPASLEGPLFELVGRPSAEPKMDGASVLFVARSISGGRLRAARVAATPDPARPGAHLFHLHRADVSLTASPRVYAWVARPLLFATSFALPLGITAYLFARRRNALAHLVPWLEALAALAAGLAAAAPAVVAVASLWGSR